jgi:hypothetical protein
MALTYDVATDRGKVRLLSTDSDATNPTFDDSEIDAFLLLAPGSVYEAAALACETWARSRSKLSQVVRQLDGSSQTRYTMAELLALAGSLREAALSGALVTDAFSALVPGELLDSYRPEWRGLFDLPVVE